jgi:ribose transport system substrate-binding protein
MADGGRYAASLFDGVELQVSGPPGVDGPAEVKLLQDLGRMLAEEAIRLLGPDVSGTVVVGTTVPGVPVLDQRAQGIREAFAEKLPDVEVLGPFETKIEPTLNFGIWNGLVKANPDALAFLGTGDQDSYNLAKIKQENGGTYLTAGFDLNAATLRAVEDGTNFATLSPGHFMKDAVAIRMLAEAAVDGKPLPEGWIDSGALLVTKDNVAQIIARQESEEAKDKWFGPELDEFFADLDTHLRPLDEAH